ncbi:hypothetical protein [Nocardia stercoris]|uniref:Uncharacterized protein n=1 Tax=Nocardia stercoris TaxID=2483361 RepID=A0A3M2KWC2_9NOCA|nr:hypothetical protein [Nocardia stercoris]RMI29872.1 hypothetical protein EBN03_24060 [Nocardia stercoris]
MTDLVTRAQLVLLARTLNVAPERLAHLERLGAAPLHELQQRIAAALYAQHGETYARVSRAVPRVPLSLVMPIVQRNVPPALTGRVAGAVGSEHPVRAAEAIAILDTRYAADCAPYLDPRTVGRLADVAPPGPVVRVVNELLRRRDYVTAGPLLDYATPALISAIEEGVADDQGLIYSAAYAYSAQSVSTVMRHLLTSSPYRIPRMVHTVLTGTRELQLATLSMLSRCAADVVEPVCDVLVEVGSPPAIGHLVGSGLRGGAIHDLLILAGHMSARALAVFGENPVFAEPPTIPAIIGTLDADTPAGAWRGLFALIPALGTELGVKVVEQIATLPDSTLTVVPARATETDQWPALLWLLAAASPEAQIRVAATWHTLPPERRATLQWHLREHPMRDQLTALAEESQPLHLDKLFFERRHRARRRGSDDGWG